MPSSPTAETHDALLARLADCVRELVEPRRLLLFGSRARGTAGLWADFDLAFSGGRRDVRSLRRAREALDRVAGPFLVDLVDLDACDPAFRAQVEAEGRVLFERD